MPALRQKILIAEDDHDLRGMFRMALAFAGFDVREAADGLDALRVIDYDPPDLVVLDLMLPSIGGLLVQQEIAANALTRQIPIVTVTGSDLAFDESIAKCVLRKPVDPDRLVRAVRECLHSGSQEPARPS